MGPGLGHFWKRLTQQLVFTQSLGVLFLQILTSALGLVTRVIFARVLGVAGFGRFMEINAWSRTLSIFATLGIDWLLIFDLPKYEARKQWDRWRGLLRHANRMVLSTSLIGTIVLWGAGYFLASTSKFGSYGFYIAAVFFPFQTNMELRYSTLIGLRKVITARAILFIRKGPLLLLGVCAVYYFQMKHELSPTTALILDGLSMVICLVAISLAIRRYLPDPVHTALPAPMPRNWIMRALPLLLLGSMYIVNTNLDLILVGHLLGSASAGVYSVATEWAGIVTYPIRAFNSALAPHAAHLYATHQTNQLQKAVRQGLGAVTLLSLLILLAIFFLSPLVLSLYGIGFAGSYQPLLILGIGQLLFSTMGTVWFLLVVTENQNVLIWTSLLGIFSNVVLDILFIPRWEISGVAMATVVTNLIVCFLGVLHLKQKTGLVASIFLRAKDID